MSETIYSPCITSVKDQIAKLNQAKQAAQPIVTQPIVTQPATDDHTNVSSNVSVASTSSRAKKTDTYELVDESDIVRIVLQIDMGVIISNTRCASWARGQKHHPNSPDTFKVRRQLMKGPQTRDEVHAAFPEMNLKLLRAILHELREQGIIFIKNELSTTHAK